MDEHSYSLTMIDHQRPKFLSVCPCFLLFADQPIHCPCFHIGEGPDGTPLLSWSTVYCFYTLPDGTKWAEHSFLHDEDDLIAMGEKSGLSAEGLLPLKEYELLKRRGRYHSQLQNIEYEVRGGGGGGAVGEALDKRCDYGW